MKAKNYGLWAGVWAMLLVACSGEVRPPDVLDQQQMSALLLELYLAESRINLQNVPKDSGYKYFVPFEDSLLTQRALNDSVLRKSYQYYLSHPAEFERVYAAVVDSLNLRLQKAAGTPAPAN
jgi:hypothetical protein